jgi:hypothetical protein
LENLQKSTQKLNFLDFGKRYTLGDDWQSFVGESVMIHLNQLIATLMQVVIENAGAETGALVLLEEDQLIVVAQGNRNRQCDLEKLLLTVQRFLSPSFTR